MGLKRDILRLTGKLVRIDTCSSPMNTAGIRQALGMVSERLEDLGETFEKNGVISRLWRDDKNNLKPKLLLCGHMDVVKAPNYDFKTNNEEGLLLGRGVGDMKGSVVAMVESFRRLRREGLAAGIALLITGDEEVGGFNGARYVVDEIGLRPGVVFIPDGEWNFAICVSQKAPHHLLFRAEASGGHASKAFELTNPDKMVTQTIEKIQKRLSKATEKEPWESTFEITVRHTFVSKPEGGKLGIENSVNSIPGYAEALVSWRFPVEKYNFIKFRKWMDVVANKYGVSVVDLHGGGEGCVVDVNDERVLLWKRVIELVLGKKVSEVRSHGASDARHFYRYPETKILLTSSNVGEFHNDREWASLDGLCKLSEAVYLFGKKGKWR